MLTEAQQTVATLQNIATLIELGSIRISDIAAANEIARIEAGLYAWEIMCSDTSADAMERAGRFIEWVKDCVG